MTRIARKRPDNFTAEPNVSLAPNSQIKSAFRVAFVHFEDAIRLLPASPGRTGKFFRPAIIMHGPRSAS